MENKVEMTPGEMADIELRLTQINIESETLLTLLRQKRIEYKNKQKNISEDKKSIKAYLQDCAKTKRRK